MKISENDLLKKYVLEGNCHAVKIFLNFDVNPYGKIYDGFSIYDYACNLPYPEITILLQDNYLKLKALGQVN